MNKTRIPWTDYTWNVVTGCTPVSEGCQHCYAQAMARRFKWPTEVTLHPERLEEPLHLKKPSKIFVCSMADLFHDDVPDDFIGKVFGIMALCPQHTFQVLTKRPARMLEYLASDGARGRIAQIAGDIADASDPGSDPEEGSPLRIEWPLPNVWLGVTAENQARADERIPLLLQVPAAVRFVSIEPMLTEVRLPWLSWGPGFDYGIPSTPQQLHWVICGAESGPGARPMLLQWARDLRDQCQENRTAFFFKQASKSHQLGTPPVLDGRTWTEFPEARSC